MDPRLDSADRLPELYRAILDAVGELERRGLRRDATRVRRDAARAYRVWDRHAEQRLLRLRSEAERLLGGDDPRHPRRSRWLRPQLARPTRADRAVPPGDGLAERAPSA